MYSFFLRLNMNLNDSLLFGFNSMTELNGSFIMDGNSLNNENLEIVELQPVANPHNGSLSETDKNSVRNLLEGWNMGYLFQTCLGEYKFITLIATIMFLQ